MIVTQIGALIWEKVQKGKVGIRIWIRLLVAILPMVLLALWLNPETGSYQNLQAACSEYRDDLLYILDEIENTNKQIEITDRILDSSQKRADKAKVDHDKTHYNVYWIEYQYEASWGFRKIRGWKGVSSVRGFVETCLPNQECPLLGVWFSTPHPQSGNLSFLWGTG